MAEEIRLDLDDLTVGYTQPTEEDRKFTSGNVLMAADLKEMADKVELAAKAETIKSVFEEVETGLNNKADQNQGQDMAGNYWKVGSNGDLVLATTDLTLTQSGGIADAKTVGDKLSSISNEVQNRVIGLQLNDDRNLLFPVYADKEAEEGIPIVTDISNYYTKEEVDANIEAIDISEELKNYTAIDSLPDSPGEYIYNNNGSVGVQANAVFVEEQPSEGIPGVDYYVGKEGKYSHHRFVQEGDQLTLANIGAAEAGKYYRATFGTVLVGEGDEAETKSRVYSLYELDRDPEAINNDLIEDENAWIDDGSAKLVSRFQILSDKVQTVIQLTATTPQQLVLNKEELNQMIKESGKVVLGFKYSSIDAENETYGANYRLTLNGAGIESGTIEAAGPSAPAEIEIDIGSRLQEGMVHNFSLTVEDEMGSKKILKWTINYLRFTLESTFNNIQSGINESITYSAIVTGAGLLKKVNAAYNSIPFGSVTVPETTKEIKFPIPQLPHGRYTVVCNAEAEVVSNGAQKIVRTNSLRQEFIKVDSSNNSPILGCSYRNDDGYIHNIDQYSSLSIPLYIYNLDSAKANLTITLQQLVLVDGTEDTEWREISSEIQERSVGNNTLNLKMNSEGDYRLILYINEGLKELEKVVIDVQVASVQIKAFDKLLEAEVDSAKLFDFNPSLRKTFTKNGDGSSSLVIGNSVLNAKSEMSISDYDIIATTNTTFDWVKGGYQVDKNGDTYFLIKAGSSLNINYKPFYRSYDAGTGTITTRSLSNTGGTFQLVYKTEHVTRQEEFLTCYSAIENKGIIMYPHDIYVKTSQSDLRLPQAEEEIIDFGLTIAGPNSFKCIMGYEDGVSTKPLVNNEGIADKITQTEANATTISIGSPYCDVIIYRFKFFAKELSAEDMLNSYIVNSPNSLDMVERDERNNFDDLYDIASNDAHTVLKKLSQQLPGVSIILISAPRFTKGKDKNQEDHRIANTNIYHWYEPTDKEKTDKTAPQNPNWVATGEKCYHIGQGTSSNNYAAAGRNVDIDMKDATIKSLDNDTIDLSSIGVHLSNNSIPKKYFNIKVNIASSENANNALLQKRFNEGNPYKRPIVRYDENGSRDSALESKVKDTMEFHNCVLFVQETGENKVEFKDSDVHFYAIGNIGDSKKTDDTRLTDPDDPFECILEVMDYDRVLSEFPLLSESTVYDNDTPNDPTDDITKTAEQWLALEDFEEDYTYGWRYVSKAKLKDLAEEHQRYAASILGYDYDNQAEREELLTKKARDVCEKLWRNCYNDIVATKPIAEIKWPELNNSKYSVTYSDGTIEEFEDLLSFRIGTAPNNWREKIEQNIVLKSALYYSIFTTRYTMVDNRSKNLFWHFGKCDSQGNRKWDLNFDYDNDTALGIDNAGLLSFGYGYNDQDMVDNDSTTEVFRARKSTFFCRLDHFYNDTKMLPPKASGESYIKNKDTSPTFSTVYGEVNSVGVDKSIWVDTNLINEFDNWQNQWPERIWKMDIKRKYFDSYFKEQGSSPYPSAGFLENMANGRKRYQRRQFEKNQYLYMGIKHRDINMPSIFFRSDSTTKMNENLVDGNDGYIKVGMFDKAYVGYGSNANTIANCTLLRYPQDWTNYHGRLDPEDDKSKQVFKIPLQGDMYEIWGAPFIENCLGIGDTKAYTVNFARANRLQQLDLSPTLEAQAHVGTVGFLEGSPITELNITKTPNLSKIGITKDQNSDSDAIETGLSSFYNLKKMKAAKTGFNTFNFASSGKLESFEIEGNDLNDKINPEDPEDTISEVKLVLDNLIYLKQLDYTKLKNLTELTIKNGAIMTEPDGELELDNEEDPEGAAASGTNKLPSSKEILMHYYTRYKEHLSNPQEVTAPKLTKVTLEGIDWTGSNSLQNKSVRKGNTVASDDYGLLEYLYQMDNNEGNVYLSGTIHCEEIDNLSWEKYKNKWADLTITYLSYIVLHTVTFYNDDEIVDVQLVENNEKAVDPTTREVSPIAIPTREPTNTTVYTFSGWGTYDFNETVRNSLNIYAHYSEADRYYTITWKNYDGTILQTAQVKYLEGAEYTEELPQKILSDGMYYLCSGWDKYSYKIASDTIITAQFTTANPPDKGSKELKDMSVEEINAICKLGEVTPKYEEGFFELGDKIDITIGWDPDVEGDLYPDKDKKVFDLFSSPCIGYHGAAYNVVEHNTSEETQLAGPVLFNHLPDSIVCLDTGVTLFDEDDSDEFTIVMDYRFLDTYIHSGEFERDPSKIHSSQILLDCSRETATASDYRSLNIGRKSGTYYGASCNSDPEACIVTNYMKMGDAGAGESVLTDVYNEANRLNPSLMKNAQLNSWSGSHADRVVIRKKANSNKIEFFSSRPWKTDGEWDEANQFDAHGNRKYTIMPYGILKYECTISEDFKKHNKTVLLGSKRASDLASTVFDFGLASHAEVNQLKIWKTAFSDAEVIKTAAYPKETLTLWLTQFTRTVGKANGKAWYYIEEHKEGDSNISTYTYPGITLELRDFLKNSRFYEGEPNAKDGMDEEPDNWDGWDEMYTRHWLNHRVYDSLPIKWRSAIKPVHVTYLTKSGNTKTTAMCVDKLFNPSYQEYSTPTRDAPYNSEGPRSGITDMTVTYTESAYSSVAGAYVYSQLGSMRKYYNVAGKWYNAFNRTRSPLPGNSGFWRISPQGKLDQGSSDNYKAWVTFAFCI